MTQPSAPRHREPEDPEIEVEVLVDGQPLGMVPFVRQIIGHTVLAAVTTLRGAEQAQTVQVTVRRKQ